MEGLSERQTLAYGNMLSFTAKLTFQRQEEKAKMAAKPIYRVVVHQQGEIWDLYVREIFQSELWGFIEVEEFVFEDSSRVVIDPASEKLQRTFEGVKRSYLPLNAIVRIDEVEREGPLKAVKSDAQVAEFPRPFSLPPRGD
ncbi:DUF1820 family protein [Halomonas janggokensis]|jgi:hypothetical protein|uniref:DUF1820 family protein n=2 Tax=Oceanospirillales TaxID=135619 RepID=A0ABT4IPT4_9GAMM|nr:DUF1820 family protein [Halomonas sp. CSM-2]MCW4152407.1 DUF1820 family protein [Halomonas sp. 18H]MCZ0925548.1 DUF1820 family protein [Halomonas janggokensis]MDR5886941.1 DUF1820 family protein [Halomonas janggokensis]